MTMVEHLLRAGHRRIAFIDGPALNVDARERLRGFRDALAACGAQAQGEEYPGDFDEASGHRAGLAMLAAGALPDAGFAANDHDRVGLPVRVRLGECFGTRGRGAGRVR